MKWGQNNTKNHIVAETDVYNVFEICFVWNSRGRNFILEDWLDKVMIEINSGTNVIFVQFMSRNEVKTSLKCKQQLSLDLCHVSCEISIVEVSQ
jgi:hypothetical protein